MARQSKRKPSRDTAIQMLRGGDPVPEGVVHERIADIRQQRMQRLEKRSAAARKMAGLLGRAQGVTRGDSGDEAARRAQAALLKTHKTLARQRLAAPKAVADLTGMLPGQIRATVTPPFDYDVVIPNVLGVNQPELEGTSDRLTGKMDLGTVTATEPGFNGGSMYTTVGIYFHPPGRGILTLYAAPTYSFQSWTNSLGPADIVRSFGQIGLTVYGVDVAGATTGGTGNIQATAGNEFFSWDETESGQVHLDFGANVQAPVLSAQLRVSRRLVYLLFVDADVHVEGVGWPGSLAGAKLRVTVPYLTYDFRMEQVIQPF